MGLVTGIVKSANPNTGTSPRSLIRGAMYQGPSGDTNVYTYAGTSSQLNTSFASNYPDPSTYSLWSFDTNTQQWDQYDVTSASPIRPSRGSYAEAPDQGLGFFFNGVIDSELVYVPQVSENGILVELGGMMISTSTQAQQNGTLVGL